jgi:lipopolysaccharide/colanic/teichoic acid biosynthesis glycosyltransferase
MVLLVIGLEEGQRSDSSLIWDGIAEALSAVKSEIDILGWVERQKVMGLILPDINASALATKCKRLETGVRKQLTDRFEQETTCRLSIRLHVYPEPQCLKEEELSSVNPFLYPELYVSHLVSGHSAVMKRGLDILGSLVLLIVLTPVLLMIAGLVKLMSRGPFLFRQVRIGQKMKPFMIYKFRTMYEGADHGIHHNYVSWFITSSGKAQESEKSKVFKLTNDPRITPLGHVLRKTSLDELPQLWNVLRGEMSLVGPRPSLWYELRQYKPWHRNRILEAKPGITGLWQVSGRSRTTFDEMVRLDLRYTRTSSLWTDIKILLRTPKAVILGKGAC